MKQEILMAAVGVLARNSWYADVKHKATGKPATYLFNGNQVSRETVADHIYRHYKAVEVLTIYPCDAPPTRILTKIPPDHYEFGIRLAVEAELNGIKEGIARREPIARQPITRKSILRG